MGNLNYLKFNRSFAKSFGEAIILLMVLLSATPAGSENSAPHLFRIGTGGRTGVYFPIGRIIAEGITSYSSEDASEEVEAGGVPGYIGVAQNSAGSIDNVLGVAAGDVEAGLVQADVAAWAFNGEYVFKNNDKVRVIRAVASLYPEKLQIVTRRDARIHNINDLRGKRISIDEVGSGTLAVMRIVLEAHNLSEKDFMPVYLKPVLTRDKMVNGELQGFAMMAGAPITAVSRLLNIDISLVPISDSAAARIASHYPYLVPGKIPAGTYPGIDETPTIAVHALLVVSAAMDEALVYRITAALWSQRTVSMLKAGHPQGKTIAPEKALIGISIPLHPGAKKYYEEQFARFEGQQQ